MCSKISEKFTVSDPFLYLRVMHEGLNKICHYTCRISTQKQNGLVESSFYITLHFKIHGFWCLQIVADCFWNIDGIKNGEALLGAKDCRMNEFVD